MDNNFFSKRWQIPFIILVDPWLIDKGKPVIVSCIIVANLFSQFFHINLALFATGFQWNVTSFTLLSVKMSHLKKMCISSFFSALMEVFAVSDFSPLILTLVPIQPPRFYSLQHKLMIRLKSLSWFFWWRWIYYISHVLWSSLQHHYWKAKDYSNIQGRYIKLIFRYIKSRL